MAKQKLNLFQLTSTSVAQAGASAAKVVGCQIVYAGLSGAALHRVGNGPVESTLSIRGTLAE